MSTRSNVRRDRGQAARGLLAALLVAPVLVIAAASPASALAVQILQNPGFETGTPSNPVPWVASTNQPGAVLVSGLAPDTGARSADLCNRNNCNDALTQTFAVPSSYTAATLRFRFRFDTTDDPSGCFDKLKVGLLTTAFAEIGATTICNGAVPGGAYNERVVDVPGTLSGFRGQNVLALVSATTDASLPSHVWVDNVTITFSVPEAPGAPSNVVATATGSGSATVTWGAPASGDAPTSYTVTPSAGSGGAPMTVGASTRTVSYAGLNGPSVTFAITSTNGAGTGPAGTSNPIDATGSTPVRDLVSDRQYQLTGSDGVTWMDMDTTNLATTYAPPKGGQLLLDANVDLWTADAGLNQDVAIVVGGGLYGSGTVVAWKESGGFGGTFSPNAAAVNTAVDVVGGVAYTLKLAWKANQPAAAASIFAGAGPIGGGFSPTRLTAVFTPASGSVGISTRTDQFLLSDSNGTTWMPMDTTTAGTPVSPVTLPFTAAADGVAAITGNADLWTWDVQYNQDVALKVSGGVYGTGQIVAWKESGGVAGPFSPNAALVEARVPVINGVPYVVELVWKANRPMPPGTRISAAAGSPGAFSPTTLTVAQQAASTVASRMSTSQYLMDGSDGVTWQNLDTPLHDQLPFSLTYVAPADGYVSLIGNSDLWTYVNGFNQDLAIRVTTPPGDPGTAPAGIVAWKESGGYAGLFSPNAAAVEGYYPVRAGLSYTFTLVWKMNKLGASGVRISAGAGNPSDFSPTRLDLTFRPAA